MSLFRVILAEQISINLQCAYNLLRILGLIEELKHSNSNMRDQRLTSKGNLFFGTHCTILADKSTILSLVTTGRLLQHCQAFKRIQN